MLVDDVTPNPLSIGDVQKVLAKLLKEKVSIRNLPLIFEALADFARLTGDTDLLTEYVRQALARQITGQYAVPGEPLRVITLSGKVEKIIADAVQQTEHGRYLALDPTRAQAFVESVSQALDRYPFAGQTPILLCSPAVRMYVRQLTERHFPTIPVLSYNELEADVEVQSVGMVEME